MARYIGPKLKIIRRIGKLRGLTRKKPFRRVFRDKGILKGKVIPPGQHGLVRLLKTRPYDSCESDYLIRLKVKQRLRYYYGLTERQLVNYVRKAKKFKEATGQVLLQLLEMRLDNILFRLNMAPTLVAARQYISHGHICVNNKKVNIPSFRCKRKDVISVAMKEKSLRLINTHLNDYYTRMRFYKQCLGKTLGFRLVQLKVVPDIKAALTFLRASDTIIKLNTKRIRKPSHICDFPRTLTVSTREKTRQFKIPQTDYGVKKKKDSVK
jgi:small subunit ribosomal protein S4